MVPAASLPPAAAHRFSLTDVLPGALAALRGERGRLALPPVRHAVVVLVDGLGAAQLQERAGHARRLLGAASSTSSISSGFPTTTVAAITSLTTGESPGRHGMVGYRALDPERGGVVEHLSGWPRDLDPATWQRRPTLFELSPDVRSVAVGPAPYARSEFSAAVLRGAEYLGADGLEARAALVREVVHGSDRSLTYLYVAELDVAGHRHGWQSDPWIAALEELDGVLGPLAAALPRDAGMLLTADHGMVDVAAADHVIPSPELLEGVLHVAGEPRGLQLHLAPGVVADDVAGRWRAVEGKRAWVATRDEAITAGWFGEVDPEVRPRIGDVLVVARRPVAYYVDPDDRGRRMVGQHGALTPAEASVPLLRFGAFG